MGSALDIIRASLRAIGALASGETPTSEESADALATLNRMIASWNIDNLTVFTYRTDQWPLTANKQKYTIGIDVTGALTADWGAPRPNNIERATLLIPQANGYTLRNPMEVLDDSEWDAIKLQGIANTMPLKLFYDNAYPLGDIWFYPLPSVSGLNVELRTWQKLTQFALTDTFDMPDGYEEAIVYNLALRLAPEFGGNISPLVATLAVESKARVMAANAPSLTGDCDAGVLGTGRRIRSMFNWLTGETG